jgi:hypothetical protein
MLEREVLEHEIHQLRQIIRLMLTLWLQVHARHGEGQTAKANSDTHHHVGRPIERAKQWLKLGCA